MVRRTRCLLKPSRIQLEAIIDQLKKFVKWAEETSPHTRHAGFTTKHLDEQTVERSGSRLVMTQGDATGYRGWKTWPGSYIECSPTAELVELSWAPYWSVCATEMRYGRT